MWVQSFSLVLIVKANDGIKQDVDAKINQLENTLGSIDILVNNAGIAPFERL